MRRSSDAQYPPLDLRDSALKRGQDGPQETGQRAVMVGAGKPSGDEVGVVLVDGAILGRLIFSYLRGQRGAWFTIA
jgi:hypothetical protein